MLNYEKIKDIVYRKTNDCNLHLDLLVPRAKNDEKIPCCVFFHGGGWKEGGRQDVDGFPIITDKIIESGGLRRSNIGLSAKTAAVFRKVSKTVCMR